MAARGRALNPAATGAYGVMVAEELLRDPSLFAPEKRSSPALIGEYLDLLPEAIFHASTAR